MIKKIAQIQEVSRKRKELMQQEAEATEPMLTDYTLIPTIYTYFCELFPIRQDQRNEVRRRREFMFVCITLFHPRTLLQKRTKAELLEAWCDLFPNVSRTRFSHDKENILAYYKIYKDFREHVVKAYNHVIHRLLTQDKA